MGTMFWAYEHALNCDYFFRRCGWKLETLPGIIRHKSQYTPYPKPVSWWWHLPLPPHISGKQSTNCCAFWVEMNGQVGVFVKSVALAGPQSLCPIIYDQYFTNRHWQVIYTGMLISHLNQIILIFFNGWITLTHSYLFGFMFVLFYLFVGGFVCLFSS